MTSNSLQWFTKHSRAIEIGFLVLFAALFVYALSDWFGLLPGDGGFQPLRMVLLSAALLFQAIAPFARRRSAQAFYIMLAVSMILLIMTFFVAS